MLSGACFYGGSVEWVFLLENNVRHKAVLWLKKADDCKLEL